MKTSIESNASSQTATIQEKLAEIYREESSQKPLFEALDSGSGILSVLMERERLNTLIVNLYPGNEGYSLMLRNKSNSEEVETVRLAYEESDILNFIDHELIPPVIMDLLDRVQNNLFYSGYVIAEIRDYRHLTDNLFETSYVLLKPSNHTLLCDLNAITSETQKWSAREKLVLESEMLLQTSDPLCLDPSPSVFSLALLSSRHKTFLNSTLNKSIRRCSQTSLNRSKKTKSDFFSQRFNKLRSQLKIGIGKSDTAHSSMPSCNPWIENRIEFVQPPDVDKFKQIRPHERSKLVLDNTLSFVEEFTFEADRGNNKTNLSRLTILQRTSDEEYFGSLYVDRDFKENESQGSSCKFSLGSYVNVEKYVRQFREIFTEEGRRQVKITHRVGVQAPVVTYTQVSCSNNSPVVSAEDGSRSNMAAVEQASFSTSETEVKVQTQIVLPQSLNSSGSIPPTISPQYNPTLNVPSSWNVEPALTSPPQVASLFPINKLLPPVNGTPVQAPVSLVSLSAPQRIFSPSNMNSNLLQINTSQLGCPSILLSPPADNSRSLPIHGNVSQFLSTKSPLHSPLNVRPASQVLLSGTPPSLNLQSSSVIQLPAQLVSQQLQQKQPSTSQHLHQQLQQQELHMQQQQRHFQLNMSPMLSQLKDQNKNKEA